MKKFVIVFLSLTIIITTVTGCIPDPIDDIIPGENSAFDFNINAKPVSIEEFSRTARGINISGKEYTAASVAETDFLNEYDFLSANDIANIFIADETNISISKLYFIQFNASEKASEFFNSFYSKIEPEKELVEQFGTWIYYSTETQKKLHIKYSGGRMRWSILIRQVENTLIFFDTAEGYASQAEQTFDKITNTIKYN